MRLKREFYQRNTILVARDLLGKKLVHKEDGIHYIGKIVETEAYINTHLSNGHNPSGILQRSISGLPSMITKMS